MMYSSPQTATVYWASRWLKRWPILNKYGQKLVSNLKMRHLIVLILLITAAADSHAQLLKARELFSRADSLRGRLTPLRTCYDVNYYHLDVRIDPDRRHIAGSNLFAFTAVNDFNRLQVDLFDNLRIDSIVYRGSQLPIRRE